jgi:hypothetical protein
MPEHLVNGSVNLFKKDDAESWRPRLVVVCRVAKFGLRVIMNREAVHEKRARSSRNTSSPSLAVAFPASSSSSRLKASSAQSRSISSSDSSSRLLRSLCARVARSDNSRFKAAASISRIVMLKSSLAIISRPDDLSTCYAPTLGFRATESSSYCPHFKCLSIQSNTVLCQNWEFAGFKTQWPSSGKSISFDSTPMRWTAVNNCMPSPSGTR